MRSLEKSAVQCHIRCSVMVLVGFFGWVFGFFCCLSLASCRGTRHKSSLFRESCLASIREKLEDDT